MPRMLWLADQLRKWGCTVVPVPGWETRGNANVTPKVVVNHHTASRSTTKAPSLGIVTNGRPDVPGPLCNVLIARNGVCYVVASGRSNNAGTGSWQGISGNTNTFGIEAENNGTGEPWPAAVLDAMVRVNAAVTTHLGLPAERCIGHKEWTSRKIDPNFDMNQFRLRVADRITTGPTGEPPMSVTDDVTLIQETLAGLGYKLAVDSAMGPVTIGHTANAFPAIVRERDDLKDELARQRARANELADQLAAARVERDVAHQKAADLERQLAEVPMDGHNDPAVVTKALKYETVVEGLRAVLMDTGLTGSGQ